MEKKPEHFLMFPLKVKSAMAERRMSIADVAEKVGRSYEHIRRVLSGASLATVGAAREIAQVLGMDPDELQKVAEEDRFAFLVSRRSPTVVAGQRQRLDRAWGALSQQHQQDLLDIAEMWARNDATVPVAERDEENRPAARRHKSK